MSDQCPATTRHTPAFSLEVFGLQCHFTRGHDGDHAAHAGFAKSDVFWPQEPADDDVADPYRDPVVEDRIRDAMAEAHDHPGRTITR